MRRLVTMGLLVGVPALLLASCDLSTDTEFAGSTASVAMPPAPEGTVHAVDMSFATDFIGAEDVECFKLEYSASHAIVALNWGYFDRAINQLDHVVAGGMTVDAYVWINWVDDPVQRVETALSLIEPYPVQRLWLDIERDVWGRDSEMKWGDRLPMVTAAVEACGDFPCGIYTRKNFWNSENGLGGSSEFSNLPLWYAHYDNDASFHDWYNYPESFTDWGPFGGWDDPTGKQYEDTIHAARQKVAACGKNIDWNVMYVPSTAGFRSEFGSLSVDQPSRSQWYSVSLDQSFEDPVVIMQPLSANGTDPATVRLRNVTGAGFDFQIAEWDYQDGAHPLERASYLVVEAGVHPLSGGLLIAGTVNADHSFESVEFGQRFSTTPVILSQAQTYNGASAVITRYRYVSNTRFQVRLQEEEGGNWAHPAETVGYVAFEPGYGSIGGTPFEARLTGAEVTDSWRSVGFGREYSNPLFLAGVQTLVEVDPVALRYGELTGRGVQVMLQEETSADAETGHAAEVIGFVAIGELTTGSVPPPPTGLQPDGQSYSSGMVTLRCIALAGAIEYEFDLDYLDDSAWRNYHEWNSSTSSKTIWPQYGDTSYRWRVRARNSNGWGDWSDWATFDFGLTDGDDDDDGDTGSPPPPPMGLDPNGETVSTESVELSCGAIAGALEYEFVIEYLSGGAWRHYYTYSSNANTRTFWPQYDNSSYRWKVRAQNAYGWGGFSDWASFDFGDTGGGGDPPPAPTGLDPDVVTVATASVTLSCNAIGGVTEYEFWIERWVGTSYSYYYTYSSSTNSKTFWPATPVTDYRWKVRARNANGWGDWSSWAVFFFFPP